MRLLIATQNQHKIQEYCALLEDLPLSLATPLQEGVELEVEETGASFESNASLKARAYAQASGLLALADDSGLEVDALGGKPGVHSARYAGESATDEDRCQLLLEKLEGVPGEERTARFRCAIAIASPSGKLWILEGRCEGRIACEPRGEHGFGYDPVFYLPERGKTLAELPPDAKNRISHRARAAEKARDVLQQLLTDEKNSLSRS